MRVGLLGAGRIGALHAATLHAHPSVEQLVVGDSDPRRARDVAERVEGRWTSKIEDVFQADLDAVVIAAPTVTHAELIVAAVDARLPVFCEKPPAVDAEGTLDVVRHLQAGDVPVQIGFQRRFDAGYVRVREALRDGELGNLHRVHLLTCDPEPPPAEYIPSSGGIFRDCHIHDFDVLRWVTGREVVEVFACGAVRGAAYFEAADDVDNCVAVLRLDDSTICTLQGSRYNGAGYDVRMELAGSSATWSVGLDERMPLRSAEPGERFPSGPPWESFIDRFRPAYVAEVDAFLAVVQGRIDNPCPVAEALAAEYVAEACDRSRRERRAVTLQEVLV